MKRMIIVAAILLSVSMIARAETLAEKTGINSALGVSPSTQDFVNEAAMSNMFEIQAADVAKGKDASGPINRFADQMVTDHTKVGAELKSLIADGSVNQQIPSGLDESHRKMLDELKDANGADFNSMYIKGQVSAHKDAVNLFERYSKGGDNDKLKQWAGEQLPALKDHLQMADDLNNNQKENTANNNMTAH